MSFTLESAKVALALGPVEYRCNVCGLTHRSGIPDDKILCLGKRTERAMAFIRAVHSFDAAIPVAARFRDALYDAREQYCLDRGFTILHDDELWDFLTSCITCPFEILRRGAGVPHRNKNQIAIALTEAMASRWLASRLAEPYGTAQWMLMIPAEKADRLVSSAISRTVSHTAGWWPQGGLEPHIIKAVDISNAISGASLLAIYGCLRVELDRIAIQQEGLS